MKKVLILFAICTTPLLHAEDIYVPAELNCSTGNKMSDAGAALTSESVTYRISDDLTHFFRESESAVGEASTTAYQLTQVGKHQYLASPEVGQDNEGTGYFFVSVDDDRSDIKVFTSDSFGTACGGGLIVSSLIKEGSAQN